MNKLVILVVLPCVIAMVTAMYVKSDTQSHYSYQMPVAYAPRNVAPYYNYAQNSYQAARQSRLFTYLLGGLYFLNLFNFTGNRIVG